MEKQQMVRVKRVILAGVLVFGLANQICAEESATYELGEIVVTATKLEEWTKNIPATVNVITAEEIEKSQAKSMTEVLEDVAGVSLSASDASGRNPVLTLRGVYDYNSSHVLVLVDGVPINSPDTGKPYLNAIPLNNIEKIEIVKGGNSAVWGGYAMGGVVNIITKKGKRTGAKASVSLGEWKTNIMNVSGEAVLPWDIAFSLNAGSKTSDGYRQYSNYDMQNFGGSLSKNDEKLGYKASLSFGYYNESCKYPGTLTETQWENGQYQVGDPNYWCSDGRQNNAYLRLGFEKHLPFNLCAKADINYLKKGYTFYYRKKNTPNVEKADINDVSVPGGGVQLSGEVLKNAFTLGWEMKTGYVDSRNHPANSATLEINKSTIKDKYKYTTLNYSAVYLQDMWKIFDWLNINMGIRYDALAHKIEDRKAGKEYLPKTDAWSPNFGVMFRPIAHVGLFASISQAFRLPTESQFCQTPELRPEKGINYEVGTKISTQRASVDISVYQMDVTDKIAYDTDPAGWKYRNIGAVKHQGVELSSRVKIFEGLSARISGDMIKTEIISDPKNPETIGKNFNQVPLWKVSLGLEYASREPGFVAKIDMRKVGEWYMDTKNEVTYPGYFVTDVKLSWKKNGLGYFISCNNVLDEKYCRKADISGTTKRYSPALPRTFSAGMSIEL